MKRRIKILAPFEIRTLFGKKTVVRKRTVTLDGKTYRQIKRVQRERPYSVEEMMFYDWIWGD